MEIRVFQEIMKYYPKFYKKKQEWIDHAIIDYHLYINLHALKEITSWQINHINNLD